jgi:predicted PurR-regulated permease PerM
MICLAVAQAGEQIQRYILAKTLLSCGLALALTSICYAFKVDFAASWGIFAFLLCFIPNLGPPLAVAPPFLVCLVQYGTSRALWLLAVLSLLEAVYGNWIEPLILGRSVHLSPTVTLLSFLFWGWLWGGVGMVLAVPLMAAVKCSCDNFKSLKPIGTLMGN